MKLLVLTVLVLGTVSLPVLAGVTDQAQAAAKASDARTAAGYVLGPGDQITIRTSEIDEINDKPIPVEMSGYVHVPLAGRIQAAGLTVEQFEAALTEKLKTYVRHPDVSVSVVSFHSQPVSVIGAVKNPGVYQVEGRKTLIEMLSMAGGLDPTAAGTTLKITRRLEMGALPLKGAVSDPAQGVSVAEVSLNAIMRAQDPAANILVKPEDVISVPRADMVYVIGQVMKAGAFPLNERDNVTVLQALSMAGGLDHMAKPQKAEILRTVPGQPQKVQVAINLRKILDAKAEDVVLQPEDVLFVPSSAPKKAAARAAEAAVQMATGFVIFGGL